MKLLSRRFTCSVFDEYLPQECGTTVMRVRRKRGEPTLIMMSKLRIPRNLETHSKRRRLGDCLQWRRTRLICQRACLALSLSAASASRFFGNPLLFAITFAAFAAYLCKPALPEGCTGRLEAIVAHRLCLESGSPTEYWIAEATQLGQIARAQNCNCSGIRSMVQFQVGCVNVSIY